MTAPKTRRCERCGEDEIEKYLHGGLCLDCQWAHELTEEPATCPPPEPWRSCATCGTEGIWSDLCSRCDPNLRRSVW